MRIKNYQIASMIELLYPLTMSAKNSRLKVKFLKQLMTHQQEYIATNDSQLQLQFANRNEEGDIIFEDEEKTKFKVSDEYFMEKQILLNEEFIIEMNESNKMTLLFIADLILEGEFEISGDIAFFYEDWCEEAEKVIEHYQE